MQLNEGLTKHILIVEDEGLIAADVQKKLVRLGYPIPAIAQSGVEALRCARSTPFDLALMDIRLKGDMDGIATAEALKTEFEIPVVYMTAHSDPETIGRAKLTEPLGYLLKPITDGDLRSVVPISLSVTRWRGAYAPAKPGSPPHCAVSETASWLPIPRAKSSS